MSGEEKQIKSKARVRERGEVFTAAREVNAMLDLVKDETERIESTFLEPACGDGNFLDEILRRKLAVCQRTYGKSPTDYEKFSFLACTSLYGVDILADNVARCRERLFDRWENSFKQVPGVPSRRGTDKDEVPGVPSRRISTGEAAAKRSLEWCTGEDEVPGVPSRRGADKQSAGAQSAGAQSAGEPPAIPLPARTDFHNRVARAVKRVFEKNILLGNALSMKCVDEKGNDLNEPIVFTEWKPTIGDKIHRAEFRFDVLLTSGTAKSRYKDKLGSVIEQCSEMTFSFDDSSSDASAAVNWMLDPDDPEKRRMIPAPSKTYRPIDYWRIGDEQE